MTAKEDELPPGHACHPNRRLDAYLGNMVANRRCELERLPSESDALRLVCGCAKRHFSIVEKHPIDVEGYATRKIEQIENLFTCC